MYSEEKIFAFLVELNKSGITNTACFSSYLENEFEMKSSEASAWIGNWFQSFQKPKCKDCD